MCMFVHVYVRERQRERGQRKRQRETEKENKTTKNNCNQKLYKDIFHMVFFNNAFIET